MGKARDHKIRPLTKDELEKKPTCGFEVDDPCRLSAVFRAEWWFQANRKKPDGTPEAEQLRHYDLCIVHGEEIARHRRLKI